MNKIRNFRWKEHVWELAALFAVFAVLCAFAAQKEGYHMDELLSFELANAEFNPWIVPTQPVGRLAKFVQEEIRGESLGETLANLGETVADVVQNKGASRLLQDKADVYPEPVWISGKQFRDYLTTGTGDRFNYLSVYFNVKDDNHPPLHFMLLHTMSSLFAGILHPFLGCILNILAVLGCMVCLFRLGTLLEGHGIIPEGCGRYAGICMGLLYGLSAGAAATALLIRMYGLMTFFCVALFYLHVKKWLENGFSEKNGRLLAVTALGFWTQYFFLFYCITLAAVTVAMLWAKKRFGELKRYVGTMALAAGVGVFLFPFAIQDVFSSGRGQEALRNLGSGFSGYGARLGAFGVILLEGVFGSVPAAVICLLILTAAICLLVLRKKSKGQEKGPGGAPGSFWLMLLVPVAAYFMLAARMSPYLVDRYIMPLFPFVAVALCLPAVMAFGRFCAGKKACFFLPVMVLGAVSLLSYDGEYLYKGYNRQLEIAGQYQDLACICLYDGLGYYYNLPEFMHYEKTMLLTLPELEQRQDKESLEGQRQIIVLKKAGVETEDALDALQEYGWRVERELLPEADSVYGDTIYFCVEE